MNIVPLSENYVSDIAGQLNTTQSAKNPTATTLDSFQNVFENAIDKVDQVQKEADTAIQRFAAGDLDVHTAMIEIEKASTILQLTVQIRDKMLESYQQIMSMQI
jgi:flagellar hook-basal body complex protein FliE